jgi:outer membrane protein
VVAARCADADSLTASNAPTAPLPRYTLWQAVNLAMQQNPDVLIAKKKLEEASGGIIEARAGFLPSLTTWDNYQKYESDYASLNGVNPTNRNEIWNVSVRLTETAFAGGAVVGKMGIARLNRQSRLLDYQATLDRVTLDVRLAFYEVLKDQSSIGVHQAAVDFLQKQLAYERQRIEIGTGKKLDSLRAEVELSLEQAALIESQNLWRNACLHLGELLAIPYAPDWSAGLRPGELKAVNPNQAGQQNAGNAGSETGTPEQLDRYGFTVEGELEMTPFSLTEQECLAAAMEHRPELKVSDNDVAVQKKQLVVDRSAVLPQVNVFFGYDVVSEPDRTLPDDYYKGYVTGVGVSWNIFDGFAAHGRMKATRARIDEAEISQNAVSRRVQAEVARAFHDLQRARETVASQRENVELAGQSQSLADANFQQGLIAQLDLLQSRLDYTRAQTVELNARFDYNAALAQLQRAMGSQLNLAEMKGVK